jgi:hypothetical protein
VIDGEHTVVDPARWIGTRDRSWGIRPIGEPEPAGRPADPPFEGMWWLYIPMAFDDFAIVIIIQEEPSGFRSLNDCTRIWKDGRVEQLGWPRVKIHYRSGTRIPTGATIEATASDGSPVHFDVESKLPVPIHVGGGYGGDSDWLHGMWKGDNFTERLSYDMTDPAIVGRAGFGVIDHVGRAVCRDADGVEREGWGLFEHGALGRHDPSGFADWLHGMWKGDNFTERLTYDMTDPAIVGRAGFGVFDHVGRAVCRDADGVEREGWGLFEHGALGRHDPSGFADWLTVAP